MRVVGIWALEYGTASMLCLVRSIFFPSGATWRGFVLTERPSTDRIGRDRCYPSAAMLHPGSCIRCFGAYFSSDEAGAVILEAVIGMASSSGEAAPITIAYASAKAEVGPSRCRRLEWGSQMRMVSRLGRMAAFAVVVRLCRTP